MKEIMKTPLTDFCYLSTCQKPRLECSKVDPDYYDNRIQLCKVPEGMFTVQIVFKMGSGIIAVHYGKSFFASMDSAYEYVVDRWTGRWHDNMKNVLIIQQGAKSLMDRKTTMILDRNLGRNIDGKFDIIADERTELERMRDSHKPIDQKIAKAAITGGLIIVLLIIFSVMLALVIVVDWLWSLWS